MDDFGAPMLPMELHTKAFELVVVLKIYVFDKYILTNIGASRANQATKKFS